MASRGYTLIELALVVATVGIISIYVSLNWPEQTADLRAQADRLVSDIRYVQYLANARGQRFKINFLSSTTYNMTDNSGNVVSYFDGPLGTIALTQATLSATDTPLYFSTKGVPLSGATPNVITSPFSITLTATGPSAESVTVQVSPETGRTIVQ